MAGKFLSPSATWEAQHWYAFAKGRVNMVKGREAWSAAVHGWGHKESDKIERLNNNKIVILSCNKKYKYLVFISWQELLIHF